MRGPRQFSVAGPCPSGTGCGTLWVPRTSSTSRDQAVFADHATDASLSSDAVLSEVDWLG